MNNIILLNYVWKKLKKGSGESEYNTLIKINENDGNIISGIKKIKTLDLSARTNVSSFFTNVTNIEEIQKIIVNNLTGMTSIFRNCAKLKEIPFFDTSRVNSFANCFDGCQSLINVPLFNTSGVTIINGFLNTFSNCNNLDNNSLNNILQMFINATRYNGTKTLKYAGLSEEQATTCQSLSNYQAFLDAGWTTGY